MLLKGKNAIISGCNRGIGNAILHLFAKNGANIFAIVRTSNEEFVKECEKLEENYGIWIHIIFIDFSEEKQVIAGVKRIRSFKEKVDILVNNAGVAYPQRMLTMTSMMLIKDTFDVNFFNQLLFTQQISKLMMKERTGSIIFMSSSAAFDGGANVEYSASKAAILGAMKRLAVELGSYGIRVNAIAPGLTDTDMGNGMSKKDEDIASSMNIFKRKAKPEEIADAALFLASELSTFVTAQVLKVDGGLR